MSLESTAQELLNMNENIILIYAFNGTGKTQLSIAYKNLTKTSNNGQHAGVYYNAYSEDLFAWDNDEEDDGKNIHLNILPSTLNKFHSFLYEDEERIKEKLAAYNLSFSFRLNRYDDLEKGIKSITFFNYQDEDKPIKISRGEERIFVWCFYLALLEVDGWSNEQDAHIFIDDPVSSLDEHNIFITADTVFKQIETHYEKKTIILTTHHIGLFSILANRLTKGEQSAKFKHLTALRILKSTSNGVALEKPKSAVFLYHLHLFQLLNESQKDQLYTYHFALLRQLLENISSFQGSGSTGRVLRKIGIDNDADVMNVINTHSHKTPYYYQTEMMSDSDASLFKKIFNKLIEVYHFKF